MLPLRIALRYLLSKKSHSAVNVISAISIAGVAVATAAIVVVLSVFNGFTSLSEHQFSHIDPDVLVTPLHSKVIVHADSLAARLAALPEAEAAVPSLTERALAVAGNSQLGVVICGVGSDFAGVCDLATITIDGEYADTLPDVLAENVPDAYPTALAVGVLSQLGISASTIDLYVPRRVGRINPANPSGSFRQIRVVPTALLQTDRLEFDADHLIVPIEAARRLLDYADGEASEIRLAAAEGISDDALAHAAAQLLGADYNVATRHRQQAESFHMIAIEKWVTFMMLVFILVIAAFNIVSTLSLMVIEKRDNMATLRFIGASKALVRRVFMIQGALITAAGGLAGIVAGLALSLAQQWGGFIRLGGDPSKLTIAVYPVRVEVLDIVAVAALVAVVALITSQITRIFTRKIN